MPFTFSLLPFAFFPLNVLSGSNYNNIVPKKHLLDCQCFSALISLLAAIGPVAGLQAEAGGKKLIEFGWDEPDAAFMHAHVAEMEQSPFDGCVFHADLVDAPGKSQPFVWDNWGRRAFTWDQLRTSLDQLRATPFHRFTSNFLRFNTAPADLDWFDDYTAVLTNCKLAARFAREGNCKGILFDTEQYNHPLFDYRKQRDAKTKSWDEYAAQVRKRGREVMQAFQEGYPGVTLFLTFAYSLPWDQCRQDPMKLPQARYGLLAPFLDGMLDAAAGNTKIIDGYELSYAYKDTSRFAVAYRAMSSGVVPIVADPAKYRRVFSFGFGVWMDRNWRTIGWNTQDLGKNFYPPDAFEKTVRAALKTSDEYVWIYTEQPRWWSDQGKPLNLPAAYEQAVRRAKGK